MNIDASTAWIAFAKAKRIAIGTPHEVASRVKTFVESNADAQVLVFDAVTSQLVELDLRGPLAAVLRRLPVPRSSLAPVGVPELPAPRQPGRPKLGVVAREITLLPRHWEWLSNQPGGASVALRKLVEQGLRSSKDVDRIRQAREAAFRFMTAAAGNEPGFEEAARALFADQLERLHEVIARWPRDLRDHVQALAKATLPPSGDALAAAS